MNLYQRIKAAVTTRMAAESYGLKVSPSGMGLCPFHDDHHPSLKLEKRYYCFGCGEQGDVIDFTARYLGASPHSAAIQLARDFGIDPHPPTTLYLPNENPELISEEQPCILSLSREVQRLRRWKWEFAPQNVGDLWDDRFVEACLNRLKVAYNETDPRPERFLAFLDDLLYPEDIPTLQEYMGYCLIPTNKAQKMMIITGNGGEGKSRLGLVMRSILGDNMSTNSIQSVERNRFTRATLEYKLLMVDDDMKLQALPETSYIKTMVTLEGKMDLEWKGKQSEQRMMYCRFLCFGNGPLLALYDRTHGFHRRQSLLSVRDRDASRMDDPYLSEKLESEAEGIFLWMMEGLKRLIANDYKLTESERTRDNLKEAMEDSNNIAQFLESDGYIQVLSHGRSICMLPTNDGVRITWKTLWQQDPSPII